MPVPRVCLLDPDGDIATHLESSGQGHGHPGWACYHTDMWVTGDSGTRIGVVGRAVGAPFAVSPATWSGLPEHRVFLLSIALVNLEEPVITARSWTTDAPYRETPAAIASAIEPNAACVKMEAAAGDDFGR